MNSSGRILWALTLVVVVCLLFWFWFREPAEPPPVDPPKYGPVPTYEKLEAGGYLLPFEEGDPGKLLPGRPEEPMPIPRQIYERVELSIDGKPVVEEPIELPAGAQIRVHGMIYQNPNVPPFLGGGHIGWVTRADNRRGWLVDMQLSVHDADHELSREGAEFTANFTVPQTPGEYVLVVISDYNVRSSKGIPILLAGAYDAVVTAPQDTPQ